MEFTYEIHNYIKPYQTSGGISKEQYWNVISKFLPKDLTPNLSKENPENVIIIYIHKYYTLEEKAKEYHRFQYLSQAIQARRGLDRVVLSYRMITSSLKDNITFQLMETTPDIRRQVIRKHTNLFDFYHNPSLGLHPEEAHKLISEAIKGFASEADRRGRKNNMNECSYNSQLRKPLMIKQNYTRRNGKRGKAKKKSSNTG